MKYTGRAFNIIYQGTSVKVEVHTAGKQEIMKVLLPDILFITKSKDFDRYDFWTSIPQGRQEVAEIIGELIDNWSENKDKEDKSFQTSLF